MTFFVREGHSPRGEDNAASNIKKGAIRGGGWGGRTTRDLKKNTRVNLSIFLPFPLSCVASASFCYTTSSNLPHLTSCRESRNLQRRAKIKARRSCLHPGTTHLDRKLEGTGWQTPAFLHPKHFKALRPFLRAAPPTLAAENERGLDNPASSLHPAAPRVLFPRQSLSHSPCGLGGSPGCVLPRADQPEPTSSDKRMAKRIATAGAHSILAVPTGSCYPAMARSEKPRRQPSWLCRSRLCAGDSRGGAAMLPQSGSPSCPARRLGELEWLHLPGERAPRSPRSGSRGCRLLLLQRSALALPHLETVINTDLGS